MDLKCSFIAKSDASLSKSVKTPIRLRSDKITKLSIVPFSQARRIAEGHIAQMGLALRPPFPCGPKHIDQQRLHAARRNVDQETVDLAGRDCLKMLAHSP